VTKLLRDIPENDFQDCFRQWHHRLKKCTASQGEHFEGYSSRSTQASKFCCHSTIPGIKLSHYVFQCIFSYSGRPQYEQPMTFVLGRKDTISWNLEPCSLVWRCPQTSWRKNTIRRPVVFVDNAARISKHVCLGNYYFSLPLSYLSLGRSVKILKYAGRIGYQVIC
jgi:hypothetical protein